MSNTDVYGMVATSRELPHKGELRVRVLIPHRKDCIAMRNVREGRWDTPWYVNMRSGAIWRRSRMYLRLSCNTPLSARCSACALVDADDVCRTAPHGMYPRGKGGRK